MKRFIIASLFALACCIAIEAQQPLTHPWSGKRIAYFGDSITDPNNNTATVKFWQLFEQWLGTTSYVYAVSGYEWNTIPLQANQLKQQHGDDFDAIIIFIGTNDFNAGIPIGQWFTESVEQVEAATGQPKTLQQRIMRQPAMDPNTYRGRINIALDSLKRMFPQKQIVLLTPIHRAFANFGDRNLQPSEAYQNKCGEWMDAYVESVKEAGNLWAYPVIDMNALSGLYPLQEENLIYFANPVTDQLHPNNLGHERMAKTLYYQLLTLPCGK